MQREALGGLKEGTQVNWLLFLKISSGCYEKNRSWRAGNSPLCGFHLYAVTKFSGLSHPRSFSEKSGSNEVGVVDWAGNSL